MKELETLGISEEQQAQFLEAVSPRLEEYGSLIRGYIQNTHVGRDRKTLRRLSAQIEKMLGTIEALGWDTRDELARAIGGGAIPGRVSLSSHEDLTDVLQALQVRSSELADWPQEHLRGRSATDEAKELFAAEFVDTICKHWPGEVVTTTDPLKTTFVTVVEKLFEEHTGVTIEGKRYVSEWLKRAES